MSRLKKYLSKKTLKKHMEKAGVDFDKHEKVLKKRHKEFMQMKKNK